MCNELDVLLCANTEPTMFTWGIFHLDMAKNKEKSAVPGNIYVIQSRIRTYSLEQYLSVLDAFRKEGCRVKLICDKSEGNQ